MYIDDTPNISAMELRTKARRLQAEAGLGLFDDLAQTSVGTNDGGRRERSASRCGCDLGDVAGQVLVVQEMRIRGLVCSSHRLR